MNRCEVCGAELADVGNRCSKHKSLLDWTNGESEIEPSSDLNKLEKMAMEILKHSLSELNKSRDKHSSYNWSHEDMAEYAYALAAAMIKEGKSYETI